jgi:hypothetical protein
VLPHAATATATSSVAPAARVCDDIISISPVEPASFGPGEVLLE